MLIRTKLVLSGAAVAAVVAGLCAVLLWTAAQAVAAREAQEVALSRSRAALDLASATNTFLGGLHDEPAVEEPPGYARLRSALLRVQAVVGTPSRDVEELLALVERLRVDPVDAGRESAYAARAGEVQLRVGRLTAAVYLAVYERELATATTEARVSRTVRLTAWGASAGAALLLGAGAALVLGRLRRGLAALHDGARRIREGVLDRPVALQGRDELALLARALDETAGDLRETTVSRDRLEAVVADRTAALEGSRAELARRLVELETTRSRLGASDRLAAVGRLSRGLTHEINNPLAIVQANLDFLRDELALCEAAGLRGGDVREAVEEAAAATRRMTQIVKDLAAFSREPGNDQGPADLALVLEVVKRLVTPELRDPARLEVDLPQGPLPVRGSASALGHVFGRLVLDALASYPDDTPPGARVVRVIARRDGADVTVEVRDQGTPIPPEVLPHAFDPFFTPVAGFTAGRGGRGVGVGLAACYGLVEGVGGSICVESAPGAGTVFRVRLRAATSDTRVGFRPAAVEGGGPRRARVLVLHEDAFALGALYRLLAERFDVVPHTSPRHALTLLGAGERFDAAVVHADLREVGAEAILEALVARSPELARATVVLTERGPAGAELVEAVGAAAHGAEHERAAAG